VAENSRIDELRRRVQSEPGSIAFAQLAEEHRRLGEYEQAIQVCRVGLGQHPGYVSARVTLGRALLDMHRYDEAQAELEDALNTAPDNLAAIRALAEIHQRRGGTSEAGGRENAIPTTLTSDLRPPTSDLRPPTSDLRPPTSDPVLTELESWLAAIRADRKRR
jgi:tetratricopeptide (TPR) repeat protein